MKKQKLFVRIVCVVLVVLMAVSVGAVAITAFSANAAQSTEEVSASVSAGASGYINASYVNLRSGAGTNYSVITCMAKNTKFTFVDGKLYNSKWYKIKLKSNSKTGYVTKEYVAVSSSATASSVTGYVSDDYVNLRSGAGTNYSVVGCLRKNTKLTFVSTSLYNSAWYKVKVTSTSKTGYIKKDYVKMDSSTQPTTQPTTSASTVSGYVSDDYVNLRSGAGTNYSVVDCLRKNTKLTFVSTSLYNSAWYKVKVTSTSKTGYIKKDYVKMDSSTQPTTQPTTSASTVSGYVSDDYVNLRSGAGTSYSVVECMRVNTKFTFVSTKLYNSDWYNIKLTSNSKTGYVKKDYVKMNSQTQPTTTQPTTTQPTTTKPSTGSSVKLSVSSKSIFTGNRFAITATASGSVSWSSSNTGVATVDSRGIVTAKKAGSATITAKSGSHSATCKITVKSGSSVNISNSNVNLPWQKSMLLKSSTRGVTWSSSNTKIATVKNGVVDTVGKGYVTITASTSYGAATCLIHVMPRESVRFCYASPNSAPLNSNVSFKAITDTDRVGVYFVVTNGSTSYKVTAKNKVKDGNSYIWTGTQKLSKSGKWSVKAYSKFKTESKYYTTAGGGEGEVFVTSTTNKTTTACAERRASDEVIKLIANYEGFLPKVTADSITTDPTLGYGKVVVSGEQFYNNITSNQAYAYLCQTVNKGGYTTTTNSYLVNNGIKFNQQQFDALVCFAYNVGSGVFYNDSELQSVLLNTGSSGTIKAGASGIVSASDVNLRRGAGTNYSVVTCMNYGTKLTFVDGKRYNTNWYKVKLSNGTTGYIHKDYVSASGGSRDLNNVNKQNLINALLQYHHAAGSCYWGLLYRRVDEAETFLYGDYDRDGQHNYHNFRFSCYSNPSFGI